MLKKDRRDLCHLEVEKDPVLVESLTWAGHCMDIFSSTQSNLVSSHPPFTDEGHEAQRMPVICSRCAAAKRWSKLWSLWIQTLCTFLWTELDHRMEGRGRKGGV